MKNLKKIFSLLIQSPYPLEMQPVLIKNFFKNLPLYLSNRFGVRKCNQLFEKNLKKFFVLKKM